MKLLVIIVTYNAMQWAERCFSSLKNSTVSPDIFVVDNGSTDGTQAFIKAHYPEVMFHQSKENLGFGMANNLGLQYALDHNYDYVYLLNQDAWVMDDTFERLIDISKQYPEYGILSPFQMNADMVHIDRSFVVNVLNWFSNPDICSDMYCQNMANIYPVSFVMAAHWFMTTKCIIKVGGFSPTFHQYAEDVNYIDRLHFWGMKVGIIPSLKAAHDRGQREENIEKNIYLGYTNCLRYLSNPNEKKAKACLRILFLCLQNVALCKSLKPIYFMFKLLYNSRKICKNRLRSQENETAFLRG